MKAVRKEERNFEKLQVLLSSTAEPLPIESASTENVSSQGLCVLTERPWKQDTVLVVLSPERELWARARVVYCQTLGDNKFAIGMELLARKGAWIRR